jgi:hypothetical protein
METTNLDLSGPKALENMGSFVIFEAFDHDLLSHDHLCSSDPIPLSDFTSNLMYLDEIVEDIPLYDIREV